MEQPGGQIWVGEQGPRVCIRVQGRATHLHGYPLRTFCNEMVRRGHRKIEMDLGKCSYMDSTFLGVLVGVSMALQKAGGAPLCVFRISQRNLELFRTLGVDRFFDMTSPIAQVTSPVIDELKPLTDAEGTKADWASVMIESHEVLVDADERNEPRFKDLLDFLKEDLARLKAPPAAEASQRWKH